jgi:hypothetical protein
MWDDGNENTLFSSFLFQFFTLPSVRATCLDRDRDRLKLIKGVTFCCPAYEALLVRVFLIQVEPSAFRHERTKGGSKMFTFPSLAWLWKSTSPPLESV